MQYSRSGMPLIGTGPAQPSHLGDPLSGHAPILGHQLVDLLQNLLCAAPTQVQAEPLSNLIDDPQPLPGLAHRWNGLVDPLHPPLHGGVAAVLLRPGGSRQNQVGHHGRGGHEYLLHYQKVELVQSSLSLVDIGVAGDGILANEIYGLEAALQRLFGHLRRCQPRPQRQIICLPGGLEELDRCRVRSPLVSGIKLGHASHIAVSLHIVLPPHRPDPGSGLADLPGNQSQSGTGLDIVRAADMLGYAHGIEQSGGGRPGVDPGRSDDLPGRNAGQLGGLLQRIVLEPGSQLGIALRPLLNELSVRQALLNYHLHHSSQEVNVAPRLDPQVQIGHPGGGGYARIGHDHRCPAVLCLLGPAGDYGMGLGEVGPYGQDASGVLQVDEIVGHGSRAQHRSQADHRGGVAEAGAVVHMG